MAGRKVYRSMQGKVIDLEKLHAKHELTPAIGNARVNARGDELGPGGRIIRKREDIMADYYAKNPNAVREESPRKIVAAPSANTTEETAKKTNTRKPTE